MGRDRLNAPWDLLGGPYAAHADLKWQQGPGPTFSADKAKKMLRDRYAVLASNLRKTVPTLQGSTAFRRTVDSLRADGWLDWHILTAIHNIVLNYRLSLTTQELRRPNAREEIVRLALEPEKETARAVPAHLFTRDAMHHARCAEMLSLLITVGFGIPSGNSSFSRHGAEISCEKRYGYLGSRHRIARKTRFHPVSAV